MKEALFWESQEHSNIKCSLCPHGCIIPLGKTGICKVRKNINGKLWTLVFPHSTLPNADPIEKKPLYHFLPGTLVFSFGTAGCNLSCKWCQNFSTSHAAPEEVFSVELPPEKIIKICKENNYKIIAYTYNDPVVFYEYVLETAKLAKEAGIKNVIVSNGYINPEPLKELCKYIDAANIDLKSMDEEVYKKYCGAKLQPVLDTLKLLKEKNIFTEVTNLLIPDLNDGKEQINELIKWVIDNLGKDTPLHFSSFFPTHKLTDREATSSETVKNARKQAIEKGMKFVYTGNIKDIDGSTTYCPKCNKALIKRDSYRITENSLKGNGCPCGEEVTGIWNNT